MKILPRNYKKIDSIDDIKNTFSLNHGGRSICLIIDSITRSHDYKLLPNEMIPPSSIPVDEGDFVYYLKFNGEELSPLNFFPEDNLNKTPEDCYRAQWWDGLKIISSFMSSISEKIKLGIFIALSIGLLIVLFFLAMTLTGKGAG